MEQAETLSVELAPELLRTVRERVEAGQFSSPGELVREALRAWLKSELEHEERIASIRARIRHSLDDPRPDVPLEEAFDRIEQLYLQRRKTRGEAA